MDINKYLNEMCGDLSKYERKWMNMPFIIGKYVYATNGHCFIGFEIPDRNSVYGYKRLTDAQNKKFINHCFFDKEDITGKPLDEILIPFKSSKEFKLGDATIDPGLLFKFYGLPNVKYEVTGSFESIKIVFDGGFGGLMPLKPIDKQINTD